MRTCLPDHQEVSPQHTVRGHLCLRSPPTSCLHHARPKASQSGRRPAVREQSTQTDQPAFQPVTGVPPDPMPARIEIRAQCELPQGPFYFTAHGDCVHLDSNCWGLWRNTPLTTRNLCRVQRPPPRRSLKASQGSRLEVPGTGML